MSWLEDGGGLEELDPPLAGDIELEGEFASGNSSLEELAPLVPLVAPGLEGVWEECGLFLLVS